jgi:galactokinase
LETWIASVQTDDEWASFARWTTRETLGFDLVEPGSKRNQWVDYAAGMAVELTALGVPLRGCRALVSSTLPMEAGLASSAALELAAAWTLAAEVPPPVAPMHLALAAQRAENRYVGVRCGIMDQAAVALGRAGTALLLDCRSLAFRHVPLRLGDHAFVVIDSGSPRRLEDSQYNARRAECEAAVQVLGGLDAQIRSLRDVRASTLDAHGAALDEALRRRVEHVVGENARVGATALALEQGDLAAVGQLLSESHASLRDLFEASTPELEALVEIATGVKGVAGARLTGAGFGGCVVVLVHRERIVALTKAVGRPYTQRTKLEAQVYPVEAVDGAGLAEAPGESEVAAS